MKRFRRSTCAFLALMLLLALAVPAFAADVYRSDQRLIVDGVEIDCVKYNIDGSNYFKLRDIAYVLSGTGSAFETVWDEEQRIVSITTGQDYTAVGGELEDAADLSAQAQVSAHAIVIDGKPVDGLSVFHIGGNNYFKLRDLGEALGFDVDYDAAAGAAIVKSAGYTEDAVDGISIYSSAENWAYFETDVSGKAADAFFVCPTVYGGREGAYNMDLANEKTRSSFLGATNMEKGIYDGDCRFFAPYYRQAGLSVYELDHDEQEQYFQIAFEDVKDAFSYYYENCNDGRPIILAGFSQGADMCIRLLKECFAEEQLQDQLIACYAIGWRVTEEEIEAYPRQLRFAEGERDTGVIIAFNSEAENIGGSLMIPAGTKTLAINPLNWKTDGTPADRSLNLGACFTDYGGNITEEIPALTGAYIDGARGALKVTDISPDAYPPGLSLFQEGVYHLFDYQFFYRNLQQNVRTRIDAFPAG